MKTYDFAPISAREYPSVKLLDHPHIWGGVQFCVNLSEKPYSPELEAALAAHGIEWIHCPVSEEPGTDWLQSLSLALPKMYLAFKDGKKQIVHCDLGNNRSRTFVEALYFAILRKEYEEPYKGADNHLEYNCNQGHLPNIGETERRIRAMIGMLPKVITPTEEEMRKILLSPSPGWTRRGLTPHTKANPFREDDFMICGTPFLQSLDCAVNRYKKGEPIGDGFTVEEVEMKVSSEWSYNGRSYRGETGWVNIETPLVTFSGKTEHLEEVNEIEGFTPLRGHEYRLMVRLFYITNNSFYHRYELIKVISDNPTH